MEEDGKSAWRSAQKAESDNEGADAGSSPLHVVPTAPNNRRMVQESPVYENVAPPSCDNTPTTFVSHHVTPASPRKKHVAHGACCCGCLAPALLMVILLMCVTLQAVLIFLRVTGITIEATRDDRGTGNSSTGRSPRCPDLWIHINDKCYFFSESQKSHADSARDCEEQGSSLATVKEKTIRRLVTITGKEFWVGIYPFNKHGEFWVGKWTDGSTETISEGSGSYAKLGSRLTLENQFTKLHFICDIKAV